MLLEQLDSLLTMIADDREPEHPPVRKTEPLTVPKYYNFPYLDSPYVRRSGRVTTRAKDDE